MTSARTSRLRFAAILEHQPPSLSTIHSQVPVHLDHILARVLFQSRFVLSPNTVAGYDVAPDGRFLLVQPLHPDPPLNQIHVVLNWFDELRRLTSSN